MTITVSEEDAIQALIPDLAGDYRAMLTEAGYDPEAFESANGMTFEEYFTGLFASAELEQQMTMEYLADENYIYPVENGEPLEADKAPYTVNGNELTFDDTVLTRS